MNANFALRTTGDVGIAFATGEFQTDWAIHCEMAIETAFHT